MNMGFVRRCAMPVAAVMLLAGSVSALAAPDWDIVGIRLGMSPEQARAVLKAHAPQAQVTDTMRQFTYSDGVKQQQTPAFLGSITAMQGPANKSETLELMFSAPPMEQRLIRVIRTLVMFDDPVPMDRAMAAVTQKYGAPPRVLEAHNGRGQIARWVEAGKTVCGDTAPTSMDARQVPPVDNSPLGLSAYETWQRRKLAPADAANCSAALVVNLVTRAPREPLVTEMKFMMTDPGYAVPAMRATAQQIADLQDQAKKARLNSGATPKL
ncbi:MAG: hypothetical protein J0M00_23565 [Burkholderiales bacterium]|jgi:hypothetical protein|nr:hypothetical protein [Burkholderiales bacterium]